MGRRCCISGCPSTSRLPEHHGVTYHSFPLDSSIRAIWIKNTHLNLDRQITKSVLVCSRHFRRNDFHPIRNGKYLLKPRVFPTVFPWGKMDAAEVESDQEALKNATVDVTAAMTTNTNTNEDETKATVAATVAQILAETAELNAAAGIKSSTVPSTPTSTPKEPTGQLSATNTAENSPNPTPKYEQPTNFSIGARLEAQDSDGNWHAARVAELDPEGNDVLVRYDRSNKSRGATYTEWIAKNSTRLRQRVNLRVMPVFSLEERCMARWSGPRKFPGTVKKLLENDTYEVLFDDGYTKNVRALHMNKMPTKVEDIAPNVEMIVGEQAPTPAVVSSVKSPTNQVEANAATVNVGVSSAESSTPVASIKRPSSTNKKKSTGQRKDWPLLDMTKLDINTLNLPEIPRDGEWTCHWVNDQPIGTEGFLIVGDNRKPTVIVEDWRLPTGWVKHMYQRSNVLGKWDVILVSPTGKRFRSKSDLKVFLEDQGLVYNPDIYDFSIHRRRAKDINAYVYTPEYHPQQPLKPKSIDMSLDNSIENVNAVNSLSLSGPTDTETSQYMEAPVATPMPPMELMSPQAGEKKPDATPAEGETTAGSSELKLEDGFAYIGNLKVQIVDNLFCCPKEGCAKNFRKEDHVQMHVKHYHKEFAKLLSGCPKMQELAVKRTHPTSIEQHEHLPKNQIPNQQFFAKLHQQDLQHSRSFQRRSAAANASTAIAVNSAPTTPTTPISTPTPPTPGSGTLSTSPIVKSQSTTPALQEESKLVENSPTVTTTLTENNSPLESSFDNTTIPIGSSTVLEPTLIASPIKSSKRARFSPSKRPSGSRKSNRQRTTRRYVVAGQGGSAGPVMPQLPTTIATNELATNDFEETAHQSVNTTPESRSSEPKRRRIAPRISSGDSPATGDSSSIPSPHAQEQVRSSGVTPSSTQRQATPQYIKENGQLIKIVRMRQEEIINCICNYGEEDGLMIQCELCLCWQHGGCNGILKESEVPEKYVCFICRNPTRGRDSMRFKHDQDWLYEGKLPVANYHMPNPNSARQFDYLKRTHTLTGNLIETKRFMHSLRVKINIANNRVHPKLYLWAKKWDEDFDFSKPSAIKNEGDNLDGDSKENSPMKRMKVEEQQAPTVPNVPQPEAAIDPEECQVRLIEHVRVQQEKVWLRLQEIEAEIDSLEKLDELPDIKGADLACTKDALATYIKELETVKQIAKLSTVANSKDNKEPQAVSVNI